MNNNIFIIGSLRKTTITTKFTKPKENDIDLMTKTNNHRISEPKSGLDKNDYFLYCELDKERKTPTKKLKGLSANLEPRNSTQYNESTSINPTSETAETILIHKDNQTMTMTRKTRFLHGFNAAVTEPTIPEFVQRSRNTTMKDTLTKNITMPDSRASCGSVKEITSNDKENCLGIVKERTHKSAESRKSLNNTLLLSCKAQNRIIGELAEKNLIEYGPHERGIIRSGNKTLTDIIGQDLKTNKGEVLSTQHTSLAKRFQTQQAKGGKLLQGLFKDGISIGNIGSKVPHTVLNTSISLNNNLKVIGSRKDEHKHLDGFVIEKVIGSGSYAVVRIAIDENTKVKYAIKTYDKYKLTDVNRRKNLQNEISILSGLDHPNLIKLYKTIDTPTQIHLVMEYASNISLQQYLKSQPNKKLSENDARIIFKQIVNGIAHCHRHDIYHRDIKLENILLNHQNIVKIIDFGFSIASNKNKTLNLICGTPSYMAPELINKKEYYGHKADSWALGVLLYILLVGKFPFRGSDEAELSKKICKGKYSIPSHVTAEAQNLLERLLRINPNMRATAEDATKDSWVNAQQDSYYYPTGNYAADKIKPCKSFLNEDTNQSFYN